MLLTASRAATRLGLRMNSSSAASTGKKALESATEGGKKALESAQGAATKAFGRAQELAGPLGERVKSFSAGNRVANLLGKYREPVVYNFSVARELAKQVYIAEGLAPPRSVAAVTDVYKQAFARAADAAFWRETLASGAWAKIGIYALEAYTIFKIGEIIGRRKLVGYFPVEHHDH